MLPTLILAALTSLQPAPELIPEPVCLSDLQRFPDKDTARASWQFARAHREWAEVWAARQPWNPDWLTWLDEAQKLELIWCRLDDAYWFHCEEEQLERLAHLRQLIGLTNYRAGRMPPNVPIWRFRRAE